MLTEKGEGIKQTNKQTTKLIDTDNSMVITGGKREMGEVEESKGGINGDRRRLDLRW